MGASMSSKRRSFLTRLEGAMTESDVDDSMKLVHHYAKKGRGYFDSRLGEAETASGQTLTPAERTSIWNAIRDFDRILEGFKGDNKKVLVREISTIIDRGASSHDVGGVISQQICLCMGATMGWGTNIGTIQSNFDTQVFRSSNLMCNLLQSFDRNTNTLARETLIELCKVAQLAIFFCMAAN